MEVLTEEEFVQMAIEENIFELFIPETEEERKAYKECAEKIARLVYRFAKEYRKLEEKYGKTCGVGDTETDEEVCRWIFELIHWTHKYDLR